MSKVKNSNKIMSLLIVCMITLGIIVPTDVNAKITYDYSDVPSSFTYGHHSDGSYNFNRKTGEYSTGKSKSTTWGVDSWKIITDSGDFKNRNAYCIQWKVGMSSSNKKYKKYSESKWPPTSKAAMISGEIAYLIEKDYTGKERYGRIDSTLQYYLYNNYSLYKSTFSDRLGYGGTQTINGTSVKLFTDPIAKITNYIKKGEDAYKNISGFVTKDLPKPTAKASNPTLYYQSTGNYYYSGPITFSNLKSTYGNGETDSKVTYKVSVAKKPNDATVSLCTSSPTKSNATCTTSDSFSVTNNADKVYYLKVTGIKADETIDLKIDGSNSSKYSTSYVYYSQASASGYQKLLIPGKISVSRSNSATVSLTAPDVDSYSVSVSKTDTDGNPISGAEFQLYIDNQATNWTSTSNDKFIWKSPKSDNSASYKDKTFKFVETKAPNGFIVGTEIEEKFKEDGDYCYQYNPDGNDIDTKDINICKNKYQYMCVNDKDASVIKENDNVNCSSYSIDNDDSNTTNDNNNSNESGDTKDESGDNNPSDESGDNNSGNGNENDNKPETKDTYSKKCMVNSTTVTEDKYCDNIYYEIVSSGTNVNLVIQDLRNKVTISKRGITGAEEVPGASMKICKLSDYNKSGADCNTASTVVSGDNGGDKMEWYSANEPATWEGLETGDYAIVEKTAPEGYITPTTNVTKFNIAADGTISPVKDDKTLELDQIKDDKGNVTDYVIVVRNKANEITVSKTDIATGKELPGAELRICSAVEKSDSTSDEPTTDDKNSSTKPSEDKEESDANDTSEDTEGDYSSDDKLSDNMLIDKESGECIPVTLSDGTDAVWTSTDKPKIITGLPDGTYYLVEQTAPNGYSTTEAILFKMNKDGTLTDENGKSLKDNKLVMKDSKIGEVKTGILPIIISGVIGLGAIGGIVYAYKRNAKGVVKVNGKTKKIVDKIIPKKKEK